MAHILGERARSENIALYPIRTVAAQTGVTAVTLRAWERRHGLIRPQRTPKGHRLYTAADIARIQDILALLRQGISIGQVKPLLDDAAVLRKPPAPTPADGVWPEYRARMLRAIELFDETALDSAYNDALSLYPVDLVIRNLAMPVQRQLCLHPQAHAAGLAEQQFFSVYLRNRIGTHVHHSNTRGNGPRLLLACVPGEYHDLGLLFFALNAISHGYRVLLLGANLPLSQIPPVLAQRRCEAVILSGSAPLAPSLLAADLPRLVQNVDVPVLIGGELAVRHGQAIERAGAIVAGEGLSETLRQVSECLKPA